MSGPDATVEVGDDADGLPAAVDVAGPSVEVDVGPDRTVEGIGEDVRVVVPEAVRRRVVALAADALPMLGADEVPTSLRRFVQFAPGRRAKLAGPLLSTRLAEDTVFRQRVGARAAAALGALGTAVAAGTVPPDADRVEVAALAYLVRPPGWDALVGAAAPVAEEADVRLLRTRERELARVTEQLDRLRASTRADLDKLRAELTAARAEADELRGRARQLAKALRDAEHDGRRTADALATERGRAASAASAADAELRRVRARLVDVETDLDVARRAGREGRAADDARVWLLLETIGNAASGLRRELALSAPDAMPADLVAAASARSGAERAGSPSWAADDPARLDQLLALPRVHLVVDGYNVTKTGFGEASLEQQRTRLVTGLGGIAAQTGAEVTAVFDGAERLPVAPASPRGVRVLFSRPGETADELIRRLVRAEPPGRPVVVVSSDREVADGVRRAGAHPVPAIVLVRRLSRG